MQEPGRTLHPVPEWSCCTGVGLRIAELGVVASRETSRADRVREHSFPLACLHT